MRYLDIALDMGTALTERHDVIKMNPVQADDVDDPATDATPRAVTLHDSPVGDSRYACRLDPTTAANMSLSTEERYALRILCSPALLILDQLDTEALVTRFLTAPAFLGIKASTRMEMLLSPLPLRALLSFGLHDCTNSVTRDSR